MTESIQVYPVGRQGAYALDVADSDRLWRYFHEGYCLTLVRGGLADWRYRSKDAEASPRGVMLMEPGEVHANTRVVNPGSFFAVFIPPPLVAKLLEPFGIYTPHFKTEFLTDPVAIERLYRLRTATLTEGPAAQEEEMNLALLSILRTGAEQVPMSRSVCPGKLKRGRSALAENYFEDPSHTVDIEEVAETCGLSYHWFVHAFSKQYGLAPYQYVKALRMARVRTLMAQGPRDQIKTVGDIALASGYADPSHMQREFRQDQGVRPGELAKALHPAWQKRNRRQ
jgi:AraC-like DNA-binding protein